MKNKSKDFNIIVGISIVIVVLILIVWCVLNSSNSNMVYNDNTSTTITEENVTENSVIEDTNDITTTETYVVTSIYIESNIQNETVQNTQSSDGNNIVVNYPRLRFAKRRGLPAS